MQPIPDKSTGDELTAEEWNNIPDEVENAITSTGIVLSGADRYQLTKTVCNYVASGDYYDDVGTTNNYVLSKIGNRRAPTDYLDGLRVRFKAANTNTGASTVNVDSLGVKTIKKEDGTTDVIAGDIPTGEHIELIYDIDNDVFVLYSHKYESSLFRTGDTKYSDNPVTENGWIKATDDGTIGDPTSGASIRANNDTLSLYFMYWNNYNDTTCPVTGGRGATAQDDWDAHKNIGVPRRSGRALAVWGQGAGLTNRNAGDFLGQENHVLTEAELASHHHAYTSPLIGSEGVHGDDGSTKKYSTLNGASTTTTGSSTAHNTMQPSYFGYLYIKL